MSLLPVALRLHDDIPTRLGALKRDTRPSDTKRVSENIGRAKQLLAFETQPAEINDRTGKPCRREGELKMTGLHDTFGMMINRAAGMSQSVQPAPFFVPNSPPVVFGVDLGDAWLAGAKQDSIDKQNAECINRFAKAMQESVDLLCNPRRVHY